MKTIPRIAFFLFLSNAILSDSSEKVEELFSNHRPSQLPALAANLSAQGSIAHIKGDHGTALEKYKQSLYIRKNLGLEKTTGYAVILFLSSIVEHKLGNSCQAMTNVREVIEIYKYLGNEEEAKVAEKEGLQEFKSACEALLSQN